MNPRPGVGGSWTGENLSLTWSLASGIYSLIPATLALGRSGKLNSGLQPSTSPRSCKGPENPGGLPGRRSSV